MPAALPLAQDVPYARVLGPFVAAIAALLVTTTAGMLALSGVRAYVGGESLWSKARGEATAQLRAFAAGGDPQAHERFLQALAVPKADQRARLELDKPDLAAAARALEDGGNHPADTMTMVWLYRLFGDTPLMRESVDAWRRGDALVAELERIGAALQGQHPREAGSLEVEHLVQRIAEVDAQLEAQGRRFSGALADTSRVVLALLLGTTIALGLLLTMIGGLAARRALRRYAQGQQQLRQANTRWDLATASGGIGVYEWDVSGDVMVFDERACELYGFEHPPGSGCRVRRDAIRARLDASDRQATQALIDEAAATGKLFKHRYRVHRPDGTVRHVEATGLVQPPGDDGQRMFGIVRDVTDEVLRAHSELERAAAQRADRARLEFLSRLSHELRTPLNAVLGFAQLLKSDRDERLSPSALDRLSLIEQAGHHLLGLVDDVLDVSRIDAGRVAMQHVPTPLQPVIEGAIALTHREQAAHDIALRVELPDPSVAVQGDAQRLQQVLVNLVSNACKYNRRGGTLRIRAEREHAAVRIGVHDEGAGLDAAQLASLFQPFHRMSPRSAAGTGLGLVIVKLLVEQMGGQVTVASEVGRGTTFTVCLPAAAAAPAWAAPPAGSAPGFVEPGG